MWFADLEASHIFYLKRRNKNENVKRNKTIFIVRTGMLFILQKTQKGLRPTQERKIK